MSKCKCVSGAGQKYFGFVMSGGARQRGAALPPNIYNIFFVDISQLQYLVIGYCPTLKFLYYYVIIIGMTQNLSPTAKRMKATRDKRMAMTTDRKAKKAENQRKHRANPGMKGKDYDHKTSTFKSVKANRGNDGKGTKLESGKKYKIKK